ncbi:hypothetical protein [Thiobacillus sp.]|uniref:hypothetical protein n=1 Tax=Thiobacillus sp. TaxID=924 RepID=UPI0018441B72|nr:hypothetical protein [Thiobacillus sp.]MBC2731463.1 hypothetical protein [Thiobacillus sp.]MBC2740201.1 hypothetical protein [Thiobacillus sp.]MBC2758414.1 hypothetical protein [Thiobacillus sp.]MBD3812046.1 hypothetical protein [Betaproteobacteria bacterium]
MIGIASNFRQPGVSVMTTHAQRVKVIAENWMAELGVGLSAPRLWLVVGLDDPHRKEEHELNEDVVKAIGNRLPARSSKSGASSPTTIS